VPGGGQPDHSSTTGSRSLVWRVIPLAVIAVATAAFFAFGLNRYFTFEALSQHRDALITWRDRHEILAAATFIAIYVVVVMLSLPCATWLTIIGGFLFGAIAGTIYTVIGATFGACALFLAARFLVGDLLRAKAGPTVGKMEAGFRENAFNYLLVLRLVPLFPFWLVNLVPAFLGVSWRTFFVGTALGIIPGTFVYTLVGNGLGAVIDAGETPDLGVIFRPEVLAPLIGLALLALIPVFYRRIRGHRSAPSTNDTP
jgi:uncharacterized membrane protein YdjX (TVP38/TMEM64 family)